MTHTWKVLLKQEFSSPYIQQLSAKLQRERQYKKIFPPPDKVMRVFDLDYNDIKVVILGQDPYPTESHADGLAFSASDAYCPPMSLTRILNAVYEDVGGKIYNDYDLSRWHTQGVFLLNTILTVEEGKPLSHAAYGWKKFTSKVIELIANKENVIFITWGQEAYNVIHNHSLAIPDVNHIHSEHPLAGLYKTPPQDWQHNNCFSLANKLLKEYGKEEIQW